MGCKCPTMALFLLGEGGLMFWGILGVCFFQELGNTDMLTFLFKHI